jgi:hypothetical protein
MERAVALSILGRVSTTMVLYNSKRILDMEGVTDAPIPLPNITGAILEKVLEYCKYHTEHPTDDKSKKSEEEKKKEPIVGWDAEFCKLDTPVLFDVILAANYLDIKVLSIVFWTFSYGVEGTVGCLL